MHPWDLEDRDPDAVLDWFQSHALNACHLATCYHATRMYLPLHPRRRVLDVPGACYLPLDRSRFPRPGLAPATDDQWLVCIERFLQAASDRRFPVYAWIVLNHRDNCPAEIHDLCMRNRYGDVYTYALCPSNFEVRDCFAELCRQTESFGGFAGLELEGIGYMGYAHQSAHDKVGVALSAEEIANLSVCCCSACEREHPDRVAIQQDELRRIRSVVSLPICLRTAADPAFTGGKASLMPSESIELADSLLLTFFGKSTEAMRAELQRFRREEFAGPVYGGIMFHGPDCTAAEHLRERRSLLVETEVDGEIYYCAGLAGERNWRWLRS